MMIYRADDVLKLERRPVAVAPLSEYQEIGVRSFGKGIFHKEPVEGIELGNKRVFHIRPGDLVLSNVFAWEGAVALAGPAEEGKIGSHRFMTYVAKSDVADQRYLLYYFLSEPGLALLGRASPGSAGRNRTLAIDRFAELKLELPKLAEQLRVAARLDAIVSRVNEMDRLTMRAEAIANGLFASFVKDPASPVQVGELVTQLERRETVDAEIAYTLLGVRWYGRGLFVRERKLGNEVAAKRLQRLRAGDFVYNRLFAWKGSFALVGAEHNDAHVSNEFPAFQIDEKVILPEYLLAYFRTPAVWADALGRSTGGTPTSRNRLNEDRFLSMNIPLPSVEKQKLVVNRIRSIDQVAARKRVQAPAFEALIRSTLNQQFGSEL